MRKLFGCAGVALAWCLLASPAQAVWPFGGDGPPPRENGDLSSRAADLLARSIRIPSVNPPGNEGPLARLFVDELELAGIEARLVETPRGASKKGRAAAWGRVPGRGSKAPIVLLSHLDVVPAERGAWTLDPFAGSVVGGYVVGRGALDAKGVGVVHLLTLVALAQRQEPLERDVIFLATPDEETGGRQGAAFLLDHHRELLSGAEYLLTEGGGILVGDSGKPNIWGITVAEKAPCWVRITARGRSGHASSAPRGSALPRLVKGLSRIVDRDHPIRVLPEVERMFKKLAPLAAPEDRVGFSNLRTALEDDLEFRRRFLSDAPRSALVRNTSALTVLHAGSSTNVVAPLAIAEVDSRLLPGERCDHFIDAMRRQIDDPDLEVEAKLAFTSRAAPADTALYRAIAGVARDVDPGAFVVPRMIAGFTDAHYFRDEGIVAYGFVPRWLPANETRGVHGTNERISIENLERGVKTMVRILEGLDRESARAAGPRREPKANEVHQGRGQAEAQAEARSEP